MKRNQLFALALLQVRLGARPLVRVTAGVLAGLVLLEVAARLATGEPVPMLAPWRLVLFLVLVPALLAGVVRGGDEVRAQAVLCPALASRRAVVLTGVIARTGALVALTLCLGGLGRLLGEGGGGGDWGARLILTLVWVVEIAILTAVLSVLVPGEANALAAVVVLAGGFLVFVGNHGQEPSWLLAALFPHLADPAQLSTAAAASAGVAAALAAILVVAVRERA